MLHPSTKKLIDKLGEMTRKQRVSWIEGENGTIVHDTEGYRVVLTPEPHGVVLTDAVGREIETCTPEEIADEKDASGRPYPLFVRELFQEAHRHARGAEKAIRTLLAGLEAAAEEEEAVTAAAPEPEPAPEPETMTDETTSFDGEGAITAAVATLADQINNSAPMAGPEVNAAPEAEEEAEPEAEAEPSAWAAAPEPEPESPSLPPAYAELDTDEGEETEADIGEELPEETMEEAAALAAPEHAPESEPEAEARQEAVSEAEPEAETPDEPEPVAASAEEAPMPAAEPAPEPPAAAAPNPMQQRFSLSGIPYGMGFAGTQPLAPAPEKPAEATPEPRPHIIDGTEDLPESVPGVPEPESVSAGQDRPASSDSNGAPPPLMPRRFNPWN